MKIDKSNERFLKVSISDITVPIEYTAQLAQVVTSFEAAIKQMLIEIHTDPNYSAVYQGNIYKEGFHYYLVRPYDLRDLLKEFNITFEHLRNPVIVDQEEDDPYVSNDSVKEYFFPTEDDTVDKIKDLLPSKEDVYDEYFESAAENEYEDEPLIEERWPNGD